MKNLLLKISYNGKNYHGFQIQKNAITVQKVVQTAIEKLLKHQVELKGCSRTDAGVHAYEYCLSFKTENKIPCHKIVLGLNALLPSDIAAIFCEEKPDNFHARYCVKSKEYIYKIFNKAYRNPILNGLVYWYKWKLDENGLNNLAKSFLGTHNFKAVSAMTYCFKNNFVRTIYEFDVFKIDDIIYFKVRGDGFLYKVVRIMVGTLIEYQRSKKTEKDIKKLIESQDRNKSGKPVPSEGLYLNKVYY